VRDLEEILPIGELQLVSISTRISKEAFRKLTEIQGWIQTERKMSKVSKQEAYEWAIQIAYTCKMYELEKGDKEEKKEVLQPKKNLFNIEAYKDMSKFNGTGWRVND
jgi:hypothetical protein